MCTSWYISLILEKGIEFHYVVLVSYYTGWFEDSNPRHVSINAALIKKSVCEIWPNQNKAPKFEVLNYLSRTQFLVHVNKKENSEAFGLSFMKNNPSAVGEHLSLPNISLKYQQQQTFVHQIFPIHHRT